MLLNLLKTAKISKMRHGGNGVHNNKNAENKMKQIDDTQGNTCCTCVVICERSMILAFVCQVQIAYLISFMT